MFCTSDFTSSSNVGLEVHTTKVHTKLDLIETKEQKPDVPVQESSDYNAQRVSEKVRVVPKCPSQVCIVQLTSHVYVTKPLYF